VELPPSIWKPVCQQPITLLSTSCSSAVCSKKDPDVLWNKNCGEALNDAPASLRSASCSDTLIRGAACGANVPAPGMWKRPDGLGTAAQAPLLASLDSQVPPITGLSRDDRLTTAGPTPVLPRASPRASETEAKQPSEEPSLAALDTRDSTGTCTHHGATQTHAAATVPECTGTCWHEEQHEQAQQAKGNMDAACLAFAMAVERAATDPPVDVMHSSAVAGLKVHSFVEGTDLLGDSKTIPWFPYVGREFCQATLAEPWQPQAQ